MSRTRLLILDDHNLFRESLGRFLAIEPDLEVVGNCSTSKEALELLRTSAVDLVLLDFDLEHELGSRFITEAQAAGYRGKFLMVTAGMNALETANVQNQGVSGIFLKHSSPEALLEAIRRVMAGE